MTLTLAITILAYGLAYLAMAAIYLACARVLSWLLRRPFSWRWEFFLFLTGVVAADCYAHAPAAWRVRLLAGVAVLGLAVVSAVLWSVYGRGPREHSEPFDTGAGKGAV